MDFIEQCIDKLDNVVNEDNNKIFKLMQDIVPTYKKGGLQVVIHLFFTLEQPVPYIPYRYQQLQLDVLYLF
jgi:hypothetical protein